MIAANFLWEAMDLQAVFAPFRGDDAATAVSVGFFEAGRFGDYKTAKRGDHLRQRRLKEVFDFLRDKGSGHCANMLTMRRRMGNAARDIGRQDQAKKASQVRERLTGYRGDIAFGAQDTRPLWVPGRI
jgi:hypothetical protein